MTFGIMASDEATKYMQAPNFVVNGSETASAGLPESAIRGSPNAAALVRLLERTNYSMVQQNGQRKYGGPPPDWGANKPTPGKGCEVFIGKIPRDLFEDELIPVLETAGKIYELRLMMDFSNHNRGYAFCMYTTRDEAQAAVHQLNNYEIRKGRYIGVCISIDNCRLFVGGIPKNKGQKELMDEMGKITEGVKDCIMYPSAADKTKNRGFAFIEYDSHRDAAMARRKLIPGKIQLWGQQIAVDWAEPETQVDEEVMKTVKVLYVRGLMLTTKDETIFQLFSKYGTNSVERVKKIKDFAFVHFYDRDIAMEAMKNLNGTYIDGVQIEVTLAKPVDKDMIRYTKNNVKNVSQIPFTTFYDQGIGDSMYRSYPFIPGPPGTIPAYTSQINQPVTPAIGPWQFPGMVPALFYPAHFRSRQSRSSTGVRTSIGVNKHNQQAKFLQPPYIPMATGLRRPFHELLEDLCTKHNWGSPVYALHTATIENEVFYVYKISIAMPAANNSSQISHFQPPRLCRGVEEAKNHAAEYVLMQLNGQVDSEVMQPYQRGPQMHLQPGLQTNQEAFYSQEHFPGNMVPTAAFQSGVTSVAPTSDAPSFQSHF